MLCFYTGNIVKYHDSFNKCLQYTFSSLVIYLQGKVWLLYKRMIYFFKHANIKNSNAVIASIASNAILEYSSMY